MNIEYYYLIFIFLASLGAGAVNALAGGGTLITFPVLVALGIPPVTANITNTVALCPGYLGAAFTGIKSLQDKKRLLFFLIPAGIIGGIAGGYLLLHTGEKMFRFMIPYLILFASILLAFQNKLKNWLQKQHSNLVSGTNYIFIALPIGIASIYGGYFGAGLGVILLATLGLFINDSLNKLNTIKQLMSFFINSSAAIFFIFSSAVNWSVALIMAIGAITGGVLGGKLAGKINEQLLRWVVATSGFIIAIIYFLT